MRGLAVPFLLLIDGAAAFTKSSPSHSRMTTQLWAARSTRLFFRNEDSYYRDILGVSSDADMKEIKSAYRKLAKQYHPDANPDVDTKEQFQELYRAYEAVSDSVGKKGTPHEETTPSEAPFQRKDYRQASDFGRHTKKYEQKPHFSKNRWTDVDCQVRSHVGSKPSSPFGESKRASETFSQSSFDNTSVTGAYNQASSGSSVSSFGRQPQGTSHGYTQGAIHSKYQQPSDEPSFSRTMHCAAQPSVGNTGGTGTQATSSSTESPFGRQPQGTSHGYTQSSYGTSGAATQSQGAAHSKYQQPSDDPSFRRTMHCDATARPKGPSPFRGSQPQEPISFKKSDGAFWSADGDTASSPRPKGTTMKSRFKGPSANPSQAARPRGTNSSTMKSSRIGGFKGPMTKPDGASSFSHANTQPRSNSYSSTWSKPHSSSNYEQKQASNVKASGEGSEWWTKPSYSSYQQNSAFIPGRQQPQSSSSSYQQQQPTNDVPTSDPAQRQAPGFKGFRRPDRVAADPYEPVFGDPSEPQVGNDVRRDLKINTKTAEEGGTKKIWIRHLEQHRKGLKQKRKRIKIMISPGVEYGDFLRVPDEGDAGQNGGPAGDLYVFLTIEDGIVRTTAKNVVKSLGSAAEKSWSLMKGTASRLRRR